MDSRDSKILAGIFFTALAVRLIYIVFFFGLTPVPDPDSVDYLNYAKHLAAGLGYTDGIWKAFRAPGYPAFAAAVFSVFGQSIPALKIAQAALSALIPVLIYLIGLKVTGRKTAVAAGFFACFYLGLAIEPARILSEATFTMLFALSILLLLNTRKHFSYGAACGAALALTALTRPVGLLLAPLSLIWAAAALPARQALKSCALGLLTFTAIMSPWWIRNYRVFHAFVPVCIETGFVLKGTHVPLEQQAYTDNLPELERDRRNFSEGWEYIKAQSARSLLKTHFINFFQFLYPFLPEYDLTYVFIFPFWLFGVWFVLKSQNTGAFPLLTMFIYFPVAFAFWGTTRYRHSMGPCFILLAAIGAEELARRARAGGRESAARLAAGIWAAVNVAVFIFAEPVRMLVKRIIYS